MTDPIFPEVVIGPIVYITIGFLLAVIILLSAQILRLRREKTERSYNINQLNLKKSRRDILEAVLEEATLQSELPNKTGLSKASVSQAVQDLKHDDLVKRKKRGNSYLIEPKTERINEECERLDK